MSRMIVTAHYSAFSREIPDGLTNEGAVISTDVVRPLAAVAIAWLRS